MDAGAVGVKAAAVALIIVGVFALADQVHHVETEALHALVHPEADNLLYLTAHRGVFPVQVRLGLVEQVQVILAHLGRILPGTAAELALPVGGGAAVRPGGAEDVVVLIHRVSGQSLLEPDMLGGGVVEHHIQHQADAPPVGLLSQLFKVLHGAVAGVDGPVVRHIIAVVVLRGNEEGGQPDVIHAQLLQVIQLLGYAPQLAQTVAVGVQEGLRVNLIHNTFLEILHRKRLTQSG